MFGEPRVVDNVPKSGPANFATTDMGVTIHSRTQGRFGIIQMKREDILHAQHLAKLVNDRMPSRGFPDIVSCGKEVRCIKADPQTLWTLDLLENDTEMFKARAQTGSLPGCVLDRDTNG